MHPNSARTVQLFTEEYELHVQNMEKMAELHESYLEVPPEERKLVKEECTRIAKSFKDREAKADRRHRAADLRVQAQTLEMSEEERAQLAPDEGSVFDSVIRGLGINN